MFCFFLVVKFIFTCIKLVVESFCLELNLYWIMYFFSKLILIFVRYKIVYMYFERIESMVNWMLLILGNFKIFDWIIFKCK